MNNEYETLANCHSYRMSQGEVETNEWRNLLRCTRKRIIEEPSGRSLRL